MNYPPGTPGPRKSLYELRCENDHVWAAQGTYDLGALYVDDDECPECKEPGEVEGTLTRDDF